MRLVAALIFLLMPSAPAGAIQVLVDTGSPTELSGGASLFNQTQTLGNWQFLAQEFVLATPAEVLEIQFYAGALNGQREGTILISLTNEIGPGATVADSLLETFEVFGTERPATLVSATGEVFLPAGNYFLVFSPLVGFDGILGSTEAPSSAAGSGFYASDPSTPDLAFPAASNFKELGEVFSVRLLGNPVPEPATAPLVAFGLIGLALRRNNVSNLVSNRGSKSHQD